MSYLDFDKTLMINLEKSLSREVLRTNRKGAYHCTTIVDCNTRKYHGLLVMPVPGLDEDNHVILSAFDETVIQHGAEFNLGLHKYNGDNYSPKGHKYIRSYNVDMIPSTLYRVGGVMLEKDKLFSTSDNRILIRYTLQDAHSETTLKFRPFLAFRSVNELTHENEHLNQSYTEVANGIKMCLYDGYPDLFMQFSKPVRFVSEPYWYKGLEYPKEQERGYPYQEDLYVPGYFELPIKKGESIIFSASDTLVSPVKLKTQFERELSERTPRNNFYNCLKNSAQQFQISPNGKDIYLIAGYPWFKVRARDLFLALPGCTLSIDEPAKFRQIMDTAITALKSFMTEGTLDPVIKEINQPDVLLWCTSAIQQYALSEGPDACRALYGTFLTEIIEYITAQKHPDMRVTENGLLFADGREKAVTWMNSTVNGRPVVPRTGHIVEFNALWYNALRFHEELNGATAQTSALVKSIEESFPETFINGYHYLFDWVSGASVDWSVRPNMILAIALPYSPLAKQQQRQVLDMVTTELLTPKGIRSLSPKSEGYKPNYTGPQTGRDYSYHQGTAWPWLLGAYLEAYLKIFGKSGVSFVERMMISMEEEVQLHCISTIPELFDGSPPFTGRGGISFAANVGAMLRIVRLLERYKVDI